MKHKSKINEKKDLIKIFFRFLKEKNLYESYINNFNTEKAATFRRICSEKKPRSNFLYYWLLEKPYQLFIFEAFSWEDTDEERSFWFNVNTEWIIFCGKKEIIMKQDEYT